MTHPHVDAPRWMRCVLVLAGVYNLVWGAWVILFPLAIFRFAGLPDPTYPQIWQCVGMIVGVYGIGYLAAARDPLRHWPIVLVGLLGKIFGPIGFAKALADGVFPPVFGLTILTNDLIWWVPFALILLAARRTARARRDAREAADTPGLEEALRTFRTDSGESLDELSRRSPVLLVFLRHAGCTFCREALADLSRLDASLQQARVTPVLVHMGEPEAAAVLANRYRLRHARWISDPAQRLYRAFDLRRGSLRQLFGPGVWVRGLRAGLVDRHLVGPLAGDGFQMPGVFLLQNGRVIREFRHATAADRPDYAALAGVSPGAAPSTTAPNAA